VGSALPVLTTLRDILETGDSVHAISGCVSGTMAYGETLVVIVRMMMMMMAMQHEIKQQNERKKELHISF